VNYNISLTYLHAHHRHLIITEQYKQQVKLEYTASVERSVPRDGKGHCPVDPVGPVKSQDQDRQRDEELETMSKTKTAALITDLHNTVINLI